MKTLLIGLLFLASASSQAKESITHKNCEIAITAAKVSYYILTVSESHLQELRNKGYTTYDVSNVDQVEGSGLNLAWDLETEDHWYGDSIKFEASLKRLSSDKERNITLFSGESDDGIGKIFAKFPDCIIEKN